MRGLWWCGGELEAWAPGAGSNGSERGWSGRRGMKRGPKASERTCRSRADGFAMPTPPISLVSAQPPPDFSSPPLDFPASPFAHVVSSAWDHASSTSACGGPPHPSRLSQRLPTPQGPLPAPVRSGLLLRSRCSVEVSLGSRHCIFPSFPGGNLALDYILLSPFFLSLSLTWTCLLSSAPNHTPTSNV